MGLAHPAPEKMAKKKQLLFFDNVAASILVFCSLLSNSFCSVVFCFGLGYRDNHILLSDSYNTTQGIPYVLWFVLVTKDQHFISTDFA